MEDSFTVITSNSSSKHSIKSHKSTYFDYKNNKNCPCHFTRCRICHPYQPKLTKNEIAKIKEINKNRTKLRQLKHCKNKCQFCKNKIETANDYIEQEILKYYVQDKQNKENEKSPLIPKNQNPEAPKKNEYRLGLVDNNKPISQYFNTIKIDGDGNFEKTLLSAKRPYLHLLKNLN